jgi:hypothetical protein
MISMQDPRWGQNSHPEQGWSRTSCPVTAGAACGTGRKDESVNTLIGGFPADGPQPPILPPRDGFLFLDRDKFHASFAGDLPADLAAFMADSQAPWGVDALGGPVTDPAWRVKPSWYLVTTEDQMIPPAAQRTMSQRTGSTVVEVAASHSVYVSQPDAVASLIKQAASAAAAQQ